MAQQGTSRAFDKKSKGRTEEAARPLAPEEISARAYVLWRQRGCVEGSSEDDWYRAEQQLTAERMLEN